MAAYDIASGRLSVSGALDDYNSDFFFHRLCEVLGHDAQTTVIDLRRVTRISEACVEALTALPLDAHELERGIAILASNAIQQTLAHADLHESISLLDDETSQ